MYFYYKNISKYGLMLLLLFIICLNVTCAAAFAAEDRADSIEMTPSEFLALADENGAIVLNENVTLTNRFDLENNLSLTVNKDVELTLPRGNDFSGSSIGIPAGKKLVINGEGAITSKGPIMFYAKGGEVEINGCALHAICTVLQIEKGEAAVHGGRLTARSSNSLGYTYETVYVDRSKFTFDGGTIINASYGGSAICVCHGSSEPVKSTVIIRDGEAENSGYGGAALRVESAADIFIYGGTLTNRADVGGVVMIGAPTDLTMTNGTVQNVSTGAYTVAIWAEGSDDDKIEIKGGTVSSANGDALEIACGGGRAYLEADIEGYAYEASVNEGKFIVEVAKIGDKRYSLQGAVAAANNGTDAAKRTITVVKNAMVDTWPEMDDVSNVTINGNGKTLKVRNVTGSGDKAYLLSGARRLAVNQLKISLQQESADCGVFHMISGTLDNVEMAAPLIADDNGSVFLAVNNGAGDKVVIKNCSFGPGGKIFFADADLSKTEFHHNKILDGAVIETKSGLDNTALNLNRNYWGGTTPAAGIVPEGAVVENWYTTEDMEDVIVLDETSKQIAIGDSFPLALTADSKIQGKITWSSSKSAVANVNGDGLVTGVANGKANITARIGDAIASCEVTVGTGAGGSAGGSTIGGGGASTRPDSKVEDKNTPPAGVRGLNSIDHFAYISGYPDGTVRPEGNITRAEVAMIFFRLMLDDFRAANYTTVNSFSDVENSMWYNNAVSTAAKAGLLKGMPDGTFAGNRSITRAEFAVIAARFLGDEKVTVSPFPDTMGHWAEQDICRAVQAGWIKGDLSGTFRPNDPITRAEVMTIVNRILNRVSDVEHMLADMIVWPDNPESAWYYEAVQEATNGHDYERSELDGAETWTEFQSARDWAALERE